MRKIKEAEVKWLPDELFILQKLASYIREGDEKKIRS